MDDTPYYRADLARIHHLGFGHLVELCAPGILDILEEAPDGPVLELGCGTGLLTRQLTDAGHNVIATDASPAMLELAEQEAPDADLQRLTLPDDELPTASAIVSVGHVLNYLPDREAVERALVAIADALEPGGVLAIDLCDLRFGAVRRDAPTTGVAEEDWAIITAFATPASDRFVRSMTTFVRNDDGTWRRDDEQHHNVLVDVSEVPALLDDHGVDAEVRRSFRDETLPDGLVAIVGRKRR